MIYDVIGIGFGPSNISLAIAMEECGYQGSSIFLERNKNVLWQEGMLLDGSDIQNNPLRDLVTPVNPRSKYTFTNYLYETGNFFHYLNLGLHYPLRKDYFRYVKWVAEHFKNVRYDVNVTHACLRRDGDTLIWSLVANGQEYRARTIVLGVGRSLNVPQEFEESDNVVHLSRFLPAIEKLPTSAPIVVLGASQSAVEILLHLLGKGFERIYSVHRSFSFRLKDTSPFSDEVYFPEFVDYYHALPPEKRALMDWQVRPTNYSSADGDILHQLYLRLYELKQDGRQPLRILRNHRVAHVRNGSPITLALEEIYTGVSERLEADLVVLATGYVDFGRDGKKGMSSLLKEVSSAFRWSSNCLEVGRDYRVAYSDECQHFPALYLNGLCEATHGMGDAGSFSLVSVRARDILRGICENG